MKSFVYTLFAVVFSLIAILILSLNQITFNEDIYPVVLLKDRIGYNVINVDGVDVFYDNGIVINETLPHPNLSLKLYQLSLFYKDFYKCKVEFNSEDLLSLIGSINYTQPSLNSTEIYFNSPNVYVKIKCNCSKLNVSTENSTTYYTIEIYNNSGKIYSLSGNYSGEISSTNFDFKFYKNKIYLSGKLVGEYRINAMRTIFLSSLNYSINCKKSTINSNIVVRV